jgi:hypothetical protein
MLMQHNDRLVAHYALSNLKKFLIQLLQLQLLLLLLLAKFLIQLLQLWLLLLEGQGQVPDSAAPATDCIICSEPAVDVTFTPCMHAYCEHCITEYVIDHNGRKCPLCNRLAFGLDV